jgi:hypothetical protein
LSYPPDFVVEDPERGSPSADWPRERRAVNKNYLTGYPPGEVDFGIYVKDSDTLAAWIKKHTGPCFAPSGPRPYWDNVTNLASTTVAGQAALSFDWDTSHCGRQMTLHETVFFLGPAHVFRFDWWTTDSSYATTIQPIAQQMLDSFTR